MIGKRRIEPGRIQDRNDLRWAHPGLKDYYYVNGRKTVNKFLDPEKTLEERRAKRDKMYKDIEGTRPAVEEAYAEFGETQNFKIPGCPEEPETMVDVVVRYPKKVRRKMPVVFYIAGGAFLLGTPWLGPIEEYAKVLNCIVVAPWYRTGLDAPYPGALNDCHAAYEWMVEHAEELHIDPDKVVITGTSVGSALGLSLAFRLKRYGHKPRGVVALDPICDERSDFLSHTYWNDALDIEQVQKFMLQYLGDSDFCSNGVGPEAMANRATIEDCKGLCPVSIHVGENDVDRDPSIEFVQKLLVAGVYTQFHIMGGCCHATMFNAPADEPLRERYMELVYGEISDFLKYDMRREWLKEEGFPYLSEQEEE